MQLAATDQIQIPKVLAICLQISAAPEEKRVPAGRVMKLWHRTAVKTGHATSDAVPCTLSPPNTFLEQTAGSRIEIRSFVGVGLVH